MGAGAPARLGGQAMRTEIGRPHFSIRLSAWTATSTSVARRRSVRKRSPARIICLNLPIAALAQARFVQSEVFCHAARPRSATLCRWRSRKVGALSAVSLNTAADCGGMMITALGQRSATAAETPVWSYAPSAMNDVNKRPTGIPLVLNPPYRLEREKCHKGRILVGACLHGEPISTSQAEGTVNQLVSARMNKRWRTRWPSRRVHRVFHVRAAALDGEFGHSAVQLAA